MQGALASVAIAQAGAAYADARPAAPIAFDVHDGNLGAALMTYAGQANVQVVLGGADLQGISARPVKGRYGRREALQMLLGKAPVSIEWINDTTLAVRLVKPRKQATAFVADRPPEPAAAVPDDRNAELQPIVVTARKRGEDLQTTPVAVSAVSAAQLERQNIGRIDDLPQAVPSLNIHQQPSYTGVVQISLRGIGNSEIVLSNDSPVALYYDGVYLGHAVGGLLGMTDLQRVEVLRGPQGTLNGRNATAGSISLVSKRPSDVFGVEQKLSYGTYDNFVSRTTIDTGQIGETGFSARLTYKYQSRTGVIDDTLVSSAKDPGAINANAVILAVHGNVTPAVEVDYHFDYDAEHDVPMNLQIISATPLFVSYFGASAANGGAPFDYEGKTIAPSLVTVSPKRLGAVQLKYWGDAPLRLEGHNLTLTANLGDDLKLKSITGRRRMFQQAYSALGSYGQLRAPAGLNAVGSTIRDVDISVIPTTIYHQDQWSEELQLGGSIGRVQFVSGLYYFNEHFSQTYGTTVGATATRPVTATSGAYITGVSFLTYGGRSSSQAAYAQVSYTPPGLGDKLELTAGARYTQDVRTLNQTQPTSQVNLARNLKAKFNNFSGEGSLKYQWTPHAMTYLRIAQAYKAGGFNPRDNLNLSGFGPEHLISYEAGFKTEFLDRRLRLNGDVYHSNDRDLQVNQTFQNTPAHPCPFSSCTVVVNAGKAVYDGIELEATALPAAGWQMNGMLGYVRPRYRSFFIDPVTDIAGRPGVHFTNASKLTAGALVQYTFAPTPVGDLSVQASWDYHSKRYFDVYDAMSPNHASIEAPGFHNLSAQILLTNIPLKAFGGQYELKLYAKNLLGDYPVTQGYELGAYGSKGFGPGRTFGVDMTGRF
jgi:iron complex outermembrane receptor protein